MIVDNPDAFKAWMTSVLEPLCDADPVALAKYVYALVKKDKPTEELRTSMVAQLEVFLQKETKGFVDFLFTKLESGLKDEYTYFIKVKEEPVERGEVSVAASTVAPQEEVEDLGTRLAPFEVNTESQEKHFVNTEFTGPVAPEAEQPEPEPKDPVTPESPRLRNGSFSGTSKAAERRHSSSRSRDRKSDSERDEKERSYSLRRRNSSSSPPRRQDRSRSRSWETHRPNRRSRSRSRRSRSRGRDRSRAWRNKSPPLRRYDRKMRSWSKSPVARSHSRSPPSKGRYSRYRNQSPLVRSGSKSPHHTSPYDSPHKSGGGTPTHESNHGDDMRLSHLSQNTPIQSVVNVKEHASKRRRCRDYDERGYCMRGEMCPYDHGKDPVVLEDVGQVLSFSGPGAPPPSCLEPPAPALGMSMLQPALTPGMALHHPPQMMNRPPPNLSEYNPDAPSMEPRMWSKQPFRNSGRGMMRPGRPPLMMPHHQRELINVPTEGENEPFYSPLTLGNSNKRQCPPDFSNDADLMPPFVKQRFDYGRLGPRKGNCSLHLKKIPPGLNNIAHLHNHFVKFGKIVNIQVNFEGDLEAALITFTTHAEASAAYKSTEAVLNNRFIKVFWHNPEKDDKQENISPIVNRPSAKDRLGVPASLIPASTVHKENIGNEKIIVSGANITKTFYVSQENKRRTVNIEDKKVVITTKFPPTQDILSAREAVKRKKDELRQEAISKTQELSQRKREFLDKLFLRHSELTEKLEKGKFTVEQRAELLSAIKELQESIDTFRKGIALSVPTKAGPSTTPQLANVTPQLVKKSIEQTKKEILDAELDLMNKQQQGKDATELNKTINELKTKAHYLGKLVKKNNVQQRLSRGGVHSGRSLSYGGRGGFNPHSTVDHRPTKLLVSGFENGDKADVLEHFSKFGEVAEHVWDEATPALVIQFKTRKDAETAMAKGRNFQDRLMSVTWFNPTQNMGMRNAGISSVILLNENVDDLLPEHDEEEEALRINLDTTEDLLLQDEEEEENEDEDRSWRR